MEIIQELDKSLLLFINGINTPALDVFMQLITHRFFWIPFYLFLLYFFYRNHKSQFIYIILSIVLIILLSDQISSSFFKPYFERLRPCHDDTINFQLHLIEGICGGKYGFVSSHAANTAGLTFFIFYFLRKSKLKWMVLIWSVFVSFSRVYLGVHYVTDILAGAILGIMIAYIVIIGFEKWKLLKYENQ